MRSAAVVFVCLCFAQPAFAQSKGWIDVNFGIANAAEKNVTTEANIPDGEGEFETYRVGYNFPRGASFDFGGGFMFSRILGAGVQFIGTAHEDAADLFIRIPHPRFFNAHATDDGFTDQKLQRTEGGMNLSLVAALPTNNNNFSVRFYGGPTYFRLKADVINEIRYAQEFALFNGANFVDITSWSSEEVEESAWGFHAGADLGYFFSDHFGIGGFARLSRGTVTFGTDEYFVDSDIDVKVGGFQAGGGLRIRF
jgi:opacity protein-like surface antigen